MKFDIFGWLFIIFRIIDGWSYRLQAEKIKKIRIANGHSRKSANLHILIDSFMIWYAWFHIHDFYMTVAMIINTLFVMYYWNTIRTYYPYRKRGLVNFKKPSIFMYTYNSLLPNKFRKKL